MAINVAGGLFGKKGGLLDSSTQFLVIGAADFVEGYANIFTKLQSLVFAPGKITASSGANVDCWAGIHLPHKATVTEITVYGTNVAKTFVLWRSPFASPAEEQMATAAINTTVSKDILYSYIDNENYSYGLHVFMADTDEIWGARIKFS